MLAEAGIKETAAAARACLGISKGDELSLKERWHAVLAAERKGRQERENIKMETV